MFPFFKETCYLNTKQKRQKQQHLFFATYDFRQLVTHVYKSIKIIIKFGNWLRLIILLHTRKMEGGMGKGERGPEKGEGGGGEPGEGKSVHVAALWLLLFIQSNIINLLWPLQVMTTNNNLYPIKRLPQTAAEWNSWQAIFVTFMSFNAATLSGVALSLRCPWPSFPPYPEPHEKTSPSSEE